MNKHQLTALWYIALLLAACVIAIGFSTQRYDFPYDWHSFAGIAGGVGILGVTLIYTLSEHPNSELHCLLKTVWLPLISIAVVAGAFVFVYHIKSQKSELETNSIADREIPANELARLQPVATLDDYGKLTCNIYNGSSWEVKDIIIHVEVQGVAKTAGPINFDDLAAPAPPAPSNGSSQDAPAATPTPAPSAMPISISRDYRLTSDIEYVNPLDAWDFTSYTGIKLMPGQHWTWKIISARGYPK